MVKHIDFLSDERTLFVNLRSDSTGSLLAGHDSFVNAAGEVAIDVAVAFVDDTLESVALPAHVEVTVVHRTGGVTVREAKRKES